MKRITSWIWRQGIVSTFMTGFFVLLPIMITLAIMGWAASWVVQLLGPNRLFGNILEYVGVHLLPNETRIWIATLLGWAIVLIVIWLTGVAIKALARHRMQKKFNQLIERIPLVSVIYKPISQVIGMLQDNDDEQMKSMSVVYCSFSEENGGGFLALLASSQVFQFTGHDCHAIYIPTSPVPMSGGIVFVPVEKVKEIDMQVDDLMQIYFSLGVMANKIIPSHYLGPS